MRTRLLRTALATAVIAGSLGTAAVTAHAGAVEGDQVAAQELRNDAAQELAAARQAVLVPVGTQLELLRRAEQRAQLTGDAAEASAVGATLAGYRDLAAAVEAAPSADSVHALVAQADVDLGSAPAPDAQG